MLRYLLPLPLLVLLLSLVSCSAPYKVVTDFTVPLPEEPCPQPLTVIRLDGKDYPCTHTKSHLDPITGHRIDLYTVTNEEAHARIAFDSESGLIQSFRNTSPSTSTSTASPLILGALGIDQDTEDGQLLSMARALLAEYGIEAEEQSSVTFSQENPERRIVSFFHEHSGIPCNLMQLSVLDDGRVIWFDAQDGCPMLYANASEPIAPKTAQRDRLIEQAAKKKLAILSLKGSEISPSQGVWTVYEGSCALRYLVTVKKDGFVIQFFPVIICANQTS